jgi:hypothetical protein
VIDSLTASFQYNDFNVTITVTDTNTIISFECVQYPNARLVMVEESNRADDENDIVGLHAMEMNEVMGAAKIFLDVIHDQLRNDLRMIYLDQRAKNN